MLYFVRPSIFQCVNGTLSDVQVGVVGVGSVIQNRDGAVSRCSSETDPNLLDSSVMKRRRGPRRAPVVSNLIVNPLRMSPRPRERLVLTIYT